MAQTSWTSCLNSSDISLSCSRPTALWTLDIVFAISFKVFILLASLKIGCSVSSITDVFEKIHSCDMIICQREYILNKIRRSFAMIEACSKRERIIIKYILTWCITAISLTLKQVLNTISNSLLSNQWHVFIFSSRISTTNNTCTCLSLSYI